MRRAVPTHVGAKIHRVLVANIKGFACILQFLYYLFIYIYRVFQEYYTGRQAIASTFMQQQIPYQPVNGNNNLSL